MNHKYSFFQDRANAAGQEAESSSLSNVRDRALRSQKAWQELADRALETDQNRQAATEHTQVNSIKDAI